MLEQLGLSFLTQEPLFSTYIMPLLICLARVVDVSMGTVRSLLANKALGNFLGIYIEERIALGNSVVRIITNQDAHELAAKLRELGYRATLLTGEGNTSEVSVIFLLVRRRTLRNLIPMIKEYNPHAVYSVEDIRYADLQFEKNETGFLK